MAANSTHCFHCDGLIEGPAKLCQLTDGAQVSLCSADCAATVKRVVSAGLDNFYKDRGKDGGQGERDWSCYERPAVQKEFVCESADGVRTAQLLVQGVHCAACTWLIEETLGAMPGVLSISVNPVTTRAELNWNPDTVPLAELLRAIAHLGYTPVPFTDNEAQTAIEAERRIALRRLLVAGLGMMQVSSYAIALYAGAFQGMDAQIQEFFRLISLLVATPIVIYSGAPFFRGAWRSIRSRLLNMDVPVAIAIGAAWCASVWNTFAGSGDVYFDSATMFVFFLSGTRYLEAAGRQRALSLTNALSQHIPCTATRMIDGRPKEIGVMELERGDIVLVQPGVAFPADGALLEAQARIDESMLTGESTAVQRRRGELVAAGTINMDTATKIRVDKIGAETVMAQIGRLVTSASQEKPRLIEVTDRIATLFVSSVLLIAVATAIYWGSVEPERAFATVLAVLVVTCPCALALATPAAFTFATSRLARLGFLVRRAGALPALASVDKVMFDKTGTLTTSAIRVESIYLLSDRDERLDEQSVLAIAGALETHSAHPLASAFRDQAGVLQADKVIAVEGAGLEGMISSRRYRIGTEDFVTEISQSQAPGSGSADKARRCIYLGSDAGVLACFVMAEQLRAGCLQLPTQLAHLGVHACIASGDQSGPVATLARQLGDLEWRANMRPGDKLELLQQMQQQGLVVAAVGDGINDSPVLAGASVSIAMGSGTSVAQHSADCIWLGERLDNFAEIFAIARATMRIVKQNLAWALAYNLVALPLAVSGSLAPWMAALGMSLSSLLVMLNALRLVLYKSAHNPEPAPDLSEARPSANCCAAGDAEPEQAT